MYKWTGEMGVLALHTCLLSSWASTAQMLFISDIFTEENCKVCRVQNRNDFCKFTHQHIYIYKCIFKKREKFSHERWEENSEQSKNTTLSESFMRTICRTVASVGSGAKTWKYMF